MMYRLINEQGLYFKAGSKTTGVKFTQNREEAWQTDNKADAYDVRRVLLKRQLDIDTEIEEFTPAPASK